MTRVHSLFRVTVASVVTAMVLGACATGPRWQVGDTLDVIQARMGAPTLMCPDGVQGDRVVIWSQQPFGQQVWAARVSAEGRLQTMEQMLTDAGFQRLAEGVWTPERLRCHFGPPAEIAQVGLPSTRQVVWSYRYLQEGVWHSLMHVYLGPDGDRVTHFHSGPDPMYERDFWWF